MTTTAPTRPGDPRLTEQVEWEKSLTGRPRDMYGWRPPRQVLTEEERQHCRDAAEDPEWGLCEALLEIIERLTGERFLT